MLSPADELRLQTEEEICKNLNISLDKFRRLRRRRPIPFLRLGYRTLRYDIVDVRRALDRLKVRAVS